MRSCSFWNEALVSELEPSICQQRMALLVDIFSNCLTKSLPTLFASLTLLTNARSLDLARQCAREHSLVWRPDRRVLALIFGRYIENMVTCSRICDAIVVTFFTFKTPRLVRVRSFKIGLIFRLVQFLVLAYMIGFAILYKKGYQETDKPESSVTVKVKGIASTIGRTDLPEEYQRVWDPTDYVIPPQENGAFFVMTNAIITPRQRFGKCAEDPSISPCNRVTAENENHPECPVDFIHPVGSGIMTGRCVPASINAPGNQRNACEIYGWCRVEEDDVTNIPENATRAYLRSCKFDKDTDPSCPIFTLGYLVKEAQGDFDQIALKGAVINIGIEWYCNLDHSVESCAPVYKFNRLDADVSKVSVGWNFRYAHYYRTFGGESQRDLVKAYGILFIFTVSGKAGKFSIVPLILNIGACVALLGVATLACDFILLYVVRNREQYQENKFLEVTDEDFKTLSPRENEEHNNGDTPAVMESTPNENDFNSRLSVKSRQQHNRLNSLKDNK